MLQATLMIAKRITPEKRMGTSSKGIGSRGAMLFVLGIAVAISCFFGVMPLAAQESALDKGPPPPYVEPAAPPVAPEPTYDPVRAQKSVEIGTFYMKRGNYDAAIERFEDATHFQPKLARSYALLGEAYEKTGDRDKALANYRKYLDVYRQAPDREKILKKITKLEGQAGHSQTKEKSG
jgi:tetratricopeptide (TPR) repeat protein